MTVLVVVLPSRSPAMRPLRSTRPPLCPPVVLTMALLAMCLLSPTAGGGALHHHRKHRRHHRHGPHSPGSGHIAQPPAVPPPDAGGDPPALPPDLDDPAPAPSGDGKPCSAPSYRAPAGVPARSPATPAKPPSSPPSPAKAPSHAHSKPPSIYIAKPPVLPSAEPPTLAGDKPPSVSPARPPAPSSLPPTKAPTSSFSPSKPPSAPFSRAKPVSCTPAKPPTMPSQAQPPLLSLAKPPLLSPAAHAPEATPPTHPAIPPVAAKPPAPAKPPTHVAIPPVAAKPPAQATPPAHPANPPVAPAPAPAGKKNSSVAGMNVFDVSAFGASGNGSSEDTRAFRAAWKAACSAESATLLVPSDGVFTVTSTIFTGPCKPGLTFQIDGVVMPPDGPASWPETDSRRQWIVFYRADGMRLTGRGTIEGNGEEWWNLPCKPHRGPNGSTLPGPCDSPALIRFLASSDVRVEGLRMENSPQFHLKFDGCERVLVDGLAVSSPAFSPNTDGIHVENTTSVHIYNSRISNGDDCISIGAGCSHVHIENVTCVHGHGISIGSLGVHGTRACVSNVTVRNARVVDSDNGVRIKTWQGGAGSVTAVEFAGVRMDNVRSCIVIDQYYCLLPGRGGCANQTSAVRVAGVTYRDIRGTYSVAQAGRAPPPVRFACSDAVACTGITMAAVELLPAAGVGGGGDAAARPADPYCWNAYGVVETLTTPPVYCLQDGRPDSLQDQLPSC